MVVNTGEDVPRLVLLIVLAALIVIATVVHFARARAIKAGQNEVEEAAATAANTSAERRRNEERIFLDRHRASHSSGDFSPLARLEVNQQSLVPPPPPMAPSDEDAPRGDGRRARALLATAATLGPCRHRPRVR